MTVFYFQPSKRPVNEILSSTYSAPPLGFTTAAGKHKHTGNKNLPVRECFKKFLRMNF